MKFQIRSAISFAIFLLSIFLFTSPLSGQVEEKYHNPQKRNLPSWAEEMYRENADPGLVTKLYEDFYQKNSFVKNEHTQFYKRWRKSIIRKSFYSQRNNRNSSERSTNDWNCIGPWDWDHDAAARSYAPGSAHVYAVEQSINNPDFLYAGTATSGLYKSVDRGNNWSPTTYDLDVNSVYALEIDYTNENVVYASLLNTVMKTVDGGLNWSVTGDAGFQGLSLNIKDIMMDPTNNMVLILATGQGLFRTSNAGADWTLISAEHHLEIEFHPTNHDIIYCVKRDADNTYFTRSVNNGISFTQLGNGWPSGADHQRRTEIAVSPDAPDHVFAHATGEANGGSGLYGIYMSIDQGDNWTFQCCGPQPAGWPDLPSGNINIMAWAKDGSDNGGQYYYDVAFGISPFNSDSLWAAGVNLWVSADGGISLECKAKWSEPHLPEYVHADIHDFHYYQHSGEIWIASDGGIFLSTDNGASFQRKVFGLEGSDFWGFDQGWWEGEIMLGGAYHNGTLLKENNVYHNDWLCTDGGDGNYGRVNPGRPRNVHSWFNIKDLRSDRTLAPYTRNNPHEANASYITGEDSDILFHPNYYDTWWVGSGTAIYKTKDNGFSFEMLHDFGVNVASMDHCLSDPNIIYAVTWPGWWDKKHVYRSADGGKSWTEITPPESQLVSQFWIPYDIVADPVDTMKVTLVRTSMYNDYNNGRRIFQSIDGGQNWQNISGTSMDGSAATNAVGLFGAEGGIVIGTRKGVWYKDDNESDFINISSDLPVSTYSEKIVPYYRKQKLRNATNRSIWERDFPNPSNRVIANPAVQKDTFFCNTDTLLFRNLSVVSEFGASWLWTFPGGTPSSSTEKDPKVVYECPGRFDVSLKVTDQTGTDSVFIKDMITILKDCKNIADPGNALLTSASGDYVQVNDVNWSTNTLTITAWVKPEGIQDDYSAIFMNDAQAAGLNFKNGNNSLAYHWPGGSWSWNSGLFVPANAWSHVALVAEPGRMTLYLNGIASIHNTSLSAVDFSSFKIGSYKAWASRNFKGEIDDLCIWSRALSREEIQNSRHLNKDVNADPDILAYYKFNREDGIAADETTLNNGTYNSNASFTTSFAPVGIGTSDRLNVSSSGVYTFPNTGLELTFSAGTYPNGDLVVSHLLNPPIVKPNSNNSVLRGYYIINNYGSQTFSGLEKMYFSDAGTISNHMANNISPTLYSRNENEGTLAWNKTSQGPFVLNPGIHGGVELTDASTINSFGQYYMNRLDFLESIPNVILKSDINQSELLEGGSSAEFALISSNQGLTLTHYDQIGIEAISSPTEGAVAFDVSLKSLIYFDGQFWQKINSKAIVENLDTTVTGGSSSIFMSSNVHNPGSILNLKNAIGFLVPPGYSNAEVELINTPTEGMMIYNTDEKTIQVFDDSYWKSVIKISTNYSVPTGSPATIDGIAIGQNFKAPDALIEISSLNNKTLLIPACNRLQIPDPLSGTIIYDSGLLDYLVFDGTFWSRLILMVE